MSRISLIFLLGAAQVFLFAGLARAEGTSFLDDFTYFDTNLWSVQDHALGRGYLDPNNVMVDGDNLAIKMPARTLNGGEVSTNDLYGYGSYSARMKLPYAPTSITGFFLYKSPDYQSEIDVEIYNDSSRQIMFTTYANGSRTHTQTMQLPFDPTRGFHEYRFDYAPDSINFYVDGQLMKTWNDGLPQTSMHLMINSWFPTWLGGKKPHRDAYLYVDSISYAQ